MSDKVKAWEATQRDIPLLEGKHEIELRDMFPVWNNMACQLACEGMLMT